MEHLPVQIIEENEVVKRLLSHHVYSLKDLQLVMKSKPDTLGMWCAENENILNGKLAQICTAVKEGTEKPRNREHVRKFHNLPGVFFTLNGATLVTGKRGTGKTTFAMTQMIDAFLEFYKETIVSWLAGTLDVENFKILCTSKILIMNFREVFNIQHLLDLLDEKAKKFVTKYTNPPPEKGSKTTQQKSPNIVESQKNSIIDLLCEVINEIRLDTYEEVSKSLTEILNMSGEGAGAQVFGIVIDEPAFVFNKIESNTVKSDTRVLGKIISQLILRLNIPVVICEPVRNYYEEDNYDEIRLFLPAMIFSNISDIFYLSKTDQNFIKVSQLKSSKEAISVEPNPRYAK